MQEFTYAQKIIFIMFTCLSGLAIGSFLNVVALRLMSKESFIKGRSKCPNCSNLIAWYDNIPVVSYLLLKGKCRNCGEKISLQYPIVEISTSLVFLVIAGTFGLTLKTLFLLFLACNLIVITITDIKERYIYDYNSYSIIPVGLLYNFFDIGQNSLQKVNVLGINFNEVFIAAIIGAVASALFFEMFSRLGLLLVGEYAFGSGDTFLAAGLGAWFGWQLMITLIIISFLAQMVVGIPVIVYNMYKDKDNISLWAMGALMLSVILTFVGRYFTELRMPNHAIAIIIISLVLAVVSLFIILKRTRERKSHTFMPFGPALVIAGFVVMFCGTKFFGFIL